MATYVFKLPDVGEGTAEAEIVAWHVKVGDTVKEDQPLVDVMTDKATVELTSPVIGVITETAGQAGDKAAVGSIIVTFEVEGAGNASEQKAPAKAAAPAPKVEAPKPAVAAPPPKVEAPAPKVSEPQKAAQPRVAGERPLASPAVRKRADELGLKLQYVPGTGPGGRISHEDLDAFVASGAATMKMNSSTSMMVAIRPSTSGSLAVMASTLSRLVCARPPNSTVRPAGVGIACIRLSWVSDACENSGSELPTVSRMLPDTSPVAAIGGPVSTPLAKFPLGADTELTSATREISAAYRSTSARSRPAESAMTMSTSESESMAKSARNRSPT